MFILVSYCDNDKKSNQIKINQVGVLQKGIWMHCNYGMTAFLVNEAGGVNQRHAIYCQIEILHIDLYGSW